ncbi:MAG: hypothetical protein LDL07_14965, partial [Desulfarculus sp.]|nr:hypothetical protein [Desulfarculus sp.]
VGSPTSQGCHQLLRQGARLLTSAADLLAPGALPPAQRPLAGPPEELDLPEPARALLDLMGHEPVHVDVLARQSGLLPQEVTALLISLEMAELVEQRPGKHYARL